MFSPIWKGGYCSHRFKRWPTEGNVASFLLVGDPSRTPAVQSKIVLGASKFANCAIRTIDDFKKEKAKIEWRVTVLHYQLRNQTLAS